jgi:hypothetical protein
MNEQILWWTAIIGGSVETISQLLANGANPIQKMNNQTAEEAVLSFSRRLYRMSSFAEGVVNDPRNKRTMANQRRLSRYHEIIRLLRDAAVKWRARETRRSFIRQWIRFYRREKLIRSCILSARIYIIKTGLDGTLGPVHTIQSFLKA